MATREILQRPLDAAANAVTGLPTSVNASDAVRRDEMLAGDAAVSASIAAAVAAEAAARAAADALIPGTITALTGDVTAAGTGSVASTLANLPQAVLLARLAALTSDPTFNLHELKSIADGTLATSAATVGQITNRLAEFDGIATGAVQLSTFTPPTTGMVLARVKPPIDDFFYLSRASTATADGITILTVAGGGGGRWIRMRIPSQLALAQTAWFVDPANASTTASDENTGVDGTHQLRTRSEMFRRLGGQKLTVDAVCTIADNLQGTDTERPSFTGSQLTGTGTMKYLGVRRVVFTGTITSVTTRVGSTGTHTSMVVNGLPSTWTAGDSVTSFVGLMVEGTSGASNGVEARVNLDEGGKQAWLSTPLATTTLEATFTAGDSIRIYDVPSLGTNEFCYAGQNTYEKLKVNGGRFVNLGGFGLSMTDCAGDVISVAGSVNRTNGLSGLVGSQAIVINSGALSLQGGYERLILAGSAGVRFNACPTLKALQIEAGTTVVSQIQQTSPANLIVTSDVEFCATNAAIDGIYMLISGSHLDVGGYVYGSIAGTSLVNFGGQSSTINFARTPAVSGTNAGLIKFNLAGTTANITALATGSIIDIYGNRIDGPLGPVWMDNRGVAMANLGTGGATGTSAANIADATALAAAAGAAAAAASVPVAGHAALSVVGRAGNTGGNAADIASGADHQVLAREGTTVAFQQVITAMVADDAITNVKAANMAAHTFKANNTSATGDPLDITGTQATAELDVFDRTHKGLVPPSGGTTGTTAFLCEDFTFRVPAGTGGGGPLTGLSGDVTTAGTGVAVATIANDAVTFAKMQNIPTDTLVGRDSLLTGDPESITVGGGIEFTGSGGIQRSALTGDVTASAGSAGTAISVNAVDNTKLNDVPTGTLKGRTAAGTGDPSDLTLAVVKAALAISFADVSGTLQAAQFPALTGDVTTPGGSLVTTLANSGVLSATYGDSSHVGVFAVDLKGRITAASSNSISITAGAVSGLAAIATTGAGGDLTANSVTDAKLRQGAATSVIGRSANSTGNVADIAATVDDRVLGRRASALGYFQVDNPMIAAGAVGLNKHQAFPPHSMLGNDTGSSTDPNYMTVAAVRTFLGLDNPQSLDLFLSWGTNDGLNSDCELPDGITGNWAWWLQQKTRASDVNAIHAYIGAVNDADLNHPEIVTEFPVDAPFGHCYITAKCVRWDPQSSLGTPKLTLALSQNTLCDSAPTSEDITGTGGFGGTTRTCSFVPGDTVGVRVFPNSSWHNNGGGQRGRAKFTVHVRLMP